MSEPVRSDCFDFCSLLDSPIAFHRIFVTVSGSVTAALFLSQTVYWTKRTRNEYGWFYKSRDEWTEETGLTRFEQESARKSLKKIGVLEEKLEGLPAKLYFRLVPQKLNTILSSLFSKGGCFSATKVDIFPPTCRILSNHQAGEIPSGFYKETETTSKTTTEITKRESSPSSIPATDSPTLSLSKDHLSTHNALSHSGRDHQKSRFNDWIKNNWNDILNKYLPRFNNDENLLRWSLRNCIAWSYDNSDKARRFSDPGIRVRKWLDEEDVDRLIRAVEGQWRSARRVEMGEEIMQRGVAVVEENMIDPSDVDGVLDHFRKVFHLFREFIRKNSGKELTDSDLARLEEAIRTEPSRFAEGNDFGVLYEFYNICLL